MTRSRLSVADFALLGLAVGAAALWFLRLGSGPTTGWWLLAKGAVLPLLALLALRRRADAGGPLLGCALLAHGAGDLLLEIRFLAGVAAFFVGHLLYLTLFWRRRRSLDQTGGGVKAGVGVLGLFGATFLLLLAPRLSGALGFAVPVYVAALLAMATSALWCGRGQPWLSLGAVAFVASDALLSMELFLGGMTPGRPLVWPLYVAAQLLIALGWLTDPLARRD